MLTMSADRWILLLALCFTRVHSNDDPSDEDFHEGEYCETQKSVRASLGSPVWLPCKIDASSDKWVIWTHNNKISVANLSLEGRINFLDPRHGRVKTFPIQAFEGNFSIRIDELQTSDLGDYHCTQGDYCQKVKLLENSTLSAEMLLVISTSAGVAVLILLSVAGYFCCKNCVASCRNKTQDNANNPVNAGIEAGASAPPAPPAALHGQQMGQHNDGLVYENDDQYFASAAPTRHHSGHPGAVQNQPSQTPDGIYPNLTEFKMERVESQRTRMRFHIDLINRLRPASLSQHYYVNQGELRKQQATSTQTQARNHPRGAGAGKQKAKEDGEYKNPIYNRSTDHLNRL